MRKDHCELKKLLILVEDDGVEPPEVSHLIYSQARYHLRYKLPFCALGGTRTHKLQILNLSDMPILLRKRWRTV